jgi:hypothetical protein
MRPLLIFALIALASCSAPPPAPTPSLSADVVVPTTLPNGRAEVVTRRAYVVGETIRFQIRLVPSTGTLRGPLEPFIQASGFHGTATVKHLALTPLTATPAAPGVIDVAWDMHDDVGVAVGADDYSIVFNVVDDRERTSTVGATIQVR